MGRNVTVASSRTWPAAMLTLAGLPGHAAPAAQALYLSV
jgi:hypothetical protein